MLVRRLALTLLFVTAGAFGQEGTTTTQTSPPPKPAPALTEAEKKAAADKLAIEKLAAEKVAAEKQPSVTIDGVMLLPMPKTPAEAAARIPKNEGAEFEAKLRDSIVLVSKNPSELKTYVEWAHKNAKDITLYINGNDTGTTYEFFDQTTGALQFHLERNSGESNKKLWSALLRTPFAKWNKPPRVTATVAIDHGAAEPTNAHFKVKVVDLFSLKSLWIIALIIFLIAIFVLAKEYGLLRDPKIAGVQQPYSLGRCQMAWWFVLVIVSYVLIWLVSGDQDTITASLLGLMGISAGTALGAALIETSSSGPASLSQAAADRLAFQAALTKAQQDLATAKDAAAAAPTDSVAQKVAADAQAGVDVVTQKLNDANIRLGNATKTPKTSWWLREILSDSDGNIVLHRFQVLVWTIVLGIIFLVSVVTELSMPEFSANLLATMGISSVTYLGFKFPEK